jgi:polyisoprenoid-binding protein YceI
MKRHALLILAALFLAANIAFSQTSTRRVHFRIESGSMLSLEGTSTFHDYECSADTLLGTIEGDTSGFARSMLDSVFIHAQVDVPVKSLHGSSSGITNNMADALKGDDYPLISFVLTQCGAAPDSLKKTGVWQIATKGNLTIAGKTRPIEMQVSLTNLGKGIFRLHGSRDLLMTDYGVDPPSFMFGVMKTNPRVLIKYDLKLKAQ